MNILKSLFIAAAALALVGGVTYAFFSDTATSTGNTFSAGTLDLKLSDLDQSVQNTIDASWTGSDMAPGGSAVSGTVQLRNTGTVLANHAEVQAANTCTDASGDMDEYLEITSLSYDGGSVLGTLADNNLNGYKDLNDLTVANALDNLALADLNINHPFVMAVRLHSSTPDAYQGESCTSDLTFTLNQDATQ